MSEKEAAEIERLLDNIGSLSRQLQESNMFIQSKDQEIEDLSDQLTTMETDFWESESKLNKMESTHPRHMDRDRTDIRTYAQQFDHWHRSELIMLIDELTKRHSL